MSQTLLSHFYSSNPNKLRIKMEITPPISTQDTVFFFGKHYGKTYGQVLREEPKYPRALESIISVIKSENLPADHPKQRTVSKMLDFLLWARAQPKTSETVRVNVSSNSPRSE